MIEKMKKWWKDGKYNRVIINEKRIKNEKKYFVDKLPHNYDNKE